MNMQNKDQQIMKFDDLKDRVTCHPAAPSDLMIQNHFVYRQGTIQIPKIDFDEFYNEISNIKKQGSYITWVKPLERGERIEIVASDGSRFWIWDTNNDLIIQIIKE